VDLTLRPEPLAVSRLPGDAPWPSAPAGTSLFSATRIGAELSVVCEPASAPAGSRVEAGWRALSVAGALDLALVGVVAELTAALAEMDVTVFVLSTFDTDHLLVRTGDVDRAVEALRSAGHTVQ
jgi:hypothetical protein